MNRVCFLIDGLNLYHALKVPEHRAYRWINPEKLVYNFLKKGEDVSEIHYFSAFPHWGWSDAREMIQYLKRIEHLPSEDFFLHLGKFRKRRRQCMATCRELYISFEEKETDVNIAVKLFELAVRNKFDTAVLISGDSDLLSGIKTVKNLFPQKKVGIIIPPKRKADVLKDSADFAMKMKTIHVMSSQFEESKTG